MYIYIYIYIHVTISTRLCVLAVAGSLLGLASLPVFCFLSTLLSGGSHKTSNALFFCCVCYVWCLVVALSSVLCICCICICAFSLWLYFIFSSSFFFNRHSFFSLSTSFSFFPFVFFSVRRIHSARVQARGEGERLYRAPQGAIGNLWGILTGIIITGLFFF